MMVMNEVKSGNLKGTFQKPISLTKHPHKFSPFFPESQRKELNVGNSTFNFFTSTTYYIYDLDYLLQT